MNYGNLEQVTSYKYKIQWLFGVAPDLFENYKQELKDLYAVVRALGGNSFDLIKFKDSDGKMISQYFCPLIAGDQKKINDKVVRKIKRTLKRNNNIYYVELIRK